MAVFLNYRTPDETIRAVRSLNDADPTIDVVVVDNASGDGSPDILRTALPGVALIVADENGGFSAGCNMGIREALRRGATRVLLLNSDVVVRPGMVAALDAAMDEDARLGIVGPVVAELHDEDLVQSMGIRYHQATGRMRHFSFGTRRSTAPGSLRRIVDGVSGCAMLIRREVFERIGLLAEEYFFGFEDLDFCLRARAAGFQTACVGSALVLHEGNLSIGRHSARRVYFGVRNHLLLAYRTGGQRTPVARVLQTGWIVGFNLMHVLLVSDVRRGEGLRALMAGVRDYVDGHYGAGARI
jgi:GT2 family glycosyltransferase